VQQVGVEHAQQIKLQMNLNHKDYGIFHNQEKLILEMIVLTNIMVAIIPK
jgi:hypothetical protein